jgi:hypothetical protein
MKNLSFAAFFPSAAVSPTSFNPDGIIVFAIGRADRRRHLR